MKRNRFFAGLAALCLAAGFIFTGCNEESSDPVGKGEIPPSSVTGVSVTPAELKLIIGDAPVQLTAVVSGDNLSDAAKAVVWESQNPSIASVDQSGKVTAKAKGSVRIVAKSKINTAVSNHCAVTVDEAQTSKILYNFDLSTLGNFEDGKKTAISGTATTFYDTAVYIVPNGKVCVRAEGGRNTSINYNAENTTIATGNVGDSVTGTNGFYCGIDLSKLSIASPDEVTLSFTCWTTGSGSASKDNGIAYLVDVSTGKAIAVATNLKMLAASDPFTISVKVSKTADVRLYFTRNSNGGGGIDITEIKVTDEGSTETIVRPESISLDKSTASLTMTDSDTAPSVTLTATVLPENVTSGYGTVTWTSSNTAAATVANGVVTAVGAGTATITAATSNGKSASCTVTVTDNRTPPEPVTAVLAKTDKPVGFAQIDVSKMTKGAVKVSSKSDFVSKVQAGGYIIYVDGKIDLSDGMMPTSAGGTSTALDNFVKSKTGGDYTTYKSFIDEYTKSCSASTNHKNNPTSDSTTYAEAKAASDPKFWTLWYLNRQYGTVISVKPASNTMIIGLPGAEIYGGRININGVNNVAIRNLTIRDAYDPFPHHEENDGFNAEHDCIVIQGASYNIWIDHCTMKDSYHCGTAANGEKFQTYDGLCDMKNNSYNMTVSYCRLQDHDKTMLIGSSATDGSNASRTITLHHNYFLNCGQRLPMVRNTRLHNFNNYYDADEKVYWKNSYAVGIRENVLCVSENNYFGTGTQYSYKDSEGLLYKNGDVDNSSKKCNTSTVKTKMSDVFTPTYTYKLDSASTLNTTVPANAGAGVWSIPAGETSGL